jgi:anti-sigma factor RsiW
MIRHASMREMLARRDRLNAADEARVAAHTESCPECRERSADYAAQVAFLQSFHRQESPPGIREGLLTTVDRQHGELHASPHRTRRLRPWEVTDRVRRVLRPGTGWSRLRWPGIALAAALIVAAAVFSPMGLRRTASPANADQLLRAAAQNAQPFPSSGTAITSYLAVESGVLPDHLVPHRLVETWSATDDQHYRTQVQTIEPAIDSGTTTTIRDGSRITTYYTRTETANVRTSADPSFSVIRATMGGVGPEESIQRYLDSTQRDLPSSVSHFARIVGKTQLLGRQVDVVQFAPVVRGIHCVPTSVKGSTSHASMDCNAPIAYGTETIWIDHATHFILKDRADLSDAPSVDAAPFGSSLFQVTTFALGRGATPAELAQQPPVQPRPDISRSDKLLGGGAPPGAEVKVPHGFLPAPAPSQLPNANSDLEVMPAATGGLAGWSTSTDLRDATGIDVLFNPNAKPNVTYGYAPGDRFLLAEERIRVHGLPAELQVGTPVQAGVCQAWEGTSPDGLHTLAFARGGISVVLTSNSLSEADLVSYAAEAMCNK